MATNESLKNQLTEQNTQVVDPSKLGFKALMSTPAMKKKFTDILHEKSDSFMGSLMTLVGGDNYLSKAEPMTIIASALKAATMDLPIDKNLGYAYVVPFNRKEKVGKDWIVHNEAQFILGYKGYIQLAQRSGQYKALNALEIYEGQLIDWNPLTEEFKFDYNAKQSDNVIGYVGFFELLNGFKKTVYWTKQEIEAHRIKNAKGYDKEKLSGAWKDNYDAMAIKTVLRNLLSKWGILSVEMQTAVTSLDMTDKEIKEHLQFLQGEKRIVFNKENQEIMILNWLKYNSARSPKVSAVIDKELKEIKTLEFESEVIKKCLEYGYPIKTLKPKENTLSIGYGYGIDTVSQPSSSSASTPSPEPTPATAQEGATPASSNPFHIYQENFGVLSPLISEDINMWISDMGAELVVEAMRRAIVDQKSYRYAQGILRQWAKKNIDSLEKVKADDIRHESQTKAKQFGKNVRREKLPDWVDKPQEDSTLDLEKQAEIDRRFKAYLAKKGEQANAE